ASALNHPNIITIYDIDEAEGVHYIAMEHVEGKTLDRLIARHGLRVNEALKYAVQMATALAKAHAAGIVHRDLKPTNVMVTEDGLVKVLDFGLAKLTEAAPTGDAETAVTREPTTEEGMIVGTVGYMSPEQAEGKPVDARSDIFSFGSVLYEMLTGQRAFQGETKVSTIAAILREEPKPLSQVVEGLPREVERLVKRCLRKDREHRLQTMADLKVALEELKEESDSGELADKAAVVAGLPRHIERGGVKPPLPRRLALAAIAIVVLVVALGVVGWFWFGRSRATTPEAALTAVPLTSYTGSEYYPSFSPDGTQVAFSWDGEKQDNFDIYVKLVGAEPPLRLTTNPAVETSPAWSPDGRWIAFDRVLPGGKVAVVLISPIGGPERILTEMYFDEHNVEGHFLAWSPDSHWLAVVALDEVGGPTALFLYSVETGEKRKLTSPPVNTSGDSCPAFSPDGRTLAFFRWASWTNSDLYFLDLSQGLKPVPEPKRLTFGNWRAASPAWAMDGSSLIFSASSGQDSSLWRVAASDSSKPQRLAAIGANGAYPAISRRGNRLAYAQALYDENIWRIEIPTPGGKANPPQKFIASTRNEESARFSPDGKKIAFLSERSGSREVWVCDSDGSNAVQLTFLGGPSMGHAARWSPDSRRLTFSANIEGHPEVYVVNASGGSPQRMTFSTYSGNPSWSKDGRWILCDAMPAGIKKVPAEGGPAVPVTGAEAGWGPTESPDGKFIYYVRNTADGFTLLRVPTEGGVVQQILDSLVSFDFVVVNDGIYFTPRPDPKSGYSIQFLNTTTGKIRRIASLGKPAAYVGAVSPDRRWILYTQVDQGGSDLMLVENFR
ncbi:MAG: serine/threonine-protein kinase, partial [Acidobacteriia bacterium]|nr:serine/threonine-protein kinase [Terriglobia bacterium]